MDHIQFVLGAGYHHTWPVSKNPVREMRGRSARRWATRSSEYRGTTMACWSSRRDYRQRQRGCGRGHILRVLGTHGELQRRRPDAAPARRGRGVGAGELRGRVDRPGSCTQPTGGSATSNLNHDPSIHPRVQKKRSRKSAWRILQLVEFGMSLLFLVPSATLGDADQKVL